MTVTAAYVAAQAQRMRGQFEADRLAAELGCEVTPRPDLPGVVEARGVTGNVWLLAGSPEKVRAGARAAQMREWLAALGTLRAPEPRRRRGRKPGTANPGLSAREREVAQLATAGMTARQAGRELGISERTVHAHLRAARRKTGAPNMAALVSWMAGHPPG